MKLNRMLPQSHIFTAYCLHATIPPMCFNTRLNSYIEAKDITVLSFLLLQQCYT